MYNNNYKGSKTKHGMSQIGGQKMRGLTIREVMEWADCSKERALEIVREIEDYEDELDLDE